MKTIASASPELRNIGLSHEEIGFRRLVNQVIGDLDAADVAME